MSMSEKLTTVAVPFSENKPMVIRVKCFELESRDTFVCACLRAQGALGERETERCWEFSADVWQGVNDLGRFKVRLDFRQIARAIATTWGQENVTFSFGFVHLRREDLKDGAPRACDFQTNFADGTATIKSDGLWIPIRVVSREDAWRVMI